MVHQLIVGGAQARVPGLGSQPGAVNQHLGMLNAKANGKGLGLHVDAPVVEHLKGIAGAVAHRQHHMVAGDVLAAGQGHPAHLAAIDINIIDPTLKPNFAAQGFDGGPQVLHDFDQAIGANVGFVDVQDLRSRPGLDQLRQHLAPVVLGVADLAVELAVGKGARPPFAKLSIRFGVEVLFEPKPKGIDTAIAHRLTPLQHQGPKPHLGQQQRRKHSAGAGANHDRAGHRAVARGLGHGAIGHGGGLRHMGVFFKPLEQGFFLRGVYIHDVDQGDIAPLASIVAALDDGVVAQVGRRQVQLFENGLRQGGVGMIEGQFDLTEA